MRDDDDRHVASQNIRNKRITGARWDTATVIEPPPTAEQKKIEWEETIASGARRCVLLPLLFVRRGAAAATFAGVAVVVVALFHKVDGDYHPLLPGE